jgi:hypothetical protein
MGCANAAVRLTLLACVAGAAGTFAGACDPCAPSQDIRVAIVAAPGVDLSPARRLRIGLSIDGALPRTAELTLPEPLDDREHALLLSPDTPPSKDRYGVAVSIEALDGGGEVIAVGTTGGEVLRSGCNRLEARLGRLPGVVDLGGDGGVDLAPPVDLAPDLAEPVCSPGDPDEDGDGRPNLCDRCPADADSRPTNADFDALSDTCDPDPTRAGNTTVEFEPFLTDDGHWSGSRVVSNGALSIETDAAGTLVVGNSVDALPTEVRAQTVFYAPAFIAPGGMVSTSQAGLFLGSSADLRNAATTGVMCAVTHSPSGSDSLDLVPVSQGTFGPPSQTAIVGFATGTLYRLRLTQRGGTHTCELAGGGAPTATVTRSGTAPTGPQYPAFWARNIQVRFTSFYVATVLP